MFNKKIVSAALIFIMSSAHACEAERNMGVAPEVALNKGTDDSNIVLNIQISGSNEKDIAKIVDLITSLMDQLDPSAPAKLSWTAQNPTAALTIAALLSAGVTAAAAIAFVTLHG